MTLRLQVVTNCCPVILRLVKRGGLSRHDRGSTGELASQKLKTRTGGANICSKRCIKSCLGLSQIHAMIMASMGLKKRWALSTGSGYTGMVACAGPGSEEPKRVC